MHPNTATVSHTHHLANVALFKAMPEGLRQQFATQAHLEPYGKNTSLFLTDDKVESFFLIISGQVKVYRATQSGEEAVLDILGSGQLLGDSALFNDHRAIHSAETVAETNLLRLPLSLLEKAVDTQPDVAKAMLKRVAAQNRQQDKELEHAKLQSASQRIGCFLLRLLDAPEQGVFSITLPYDKTLIASRLGMQPETFSRALAKLKTETGLRINGAAVEGDDIQTLARYACAACASCYPCKGLK